MEAIRGWAIGICMASLAGTALHFLSPSGSMQKFFKIVLSVFFITVTVYPIVSNSIAEIDLTPDSYTYGDGYEENVSKISETVLRQAIEEIELRVSEKLEGLGVKKYKIAVNTDIDEAQSIVISSIDVAVGSEYYGLSEKIKKEIESQMECAVNVYVGGIENE